MVVVLLMSVALIVLLCVVAYTLAIYALPFMLGLTAVQFAYQTGCGLVGAGLVGLVAAGVAFGLLALMFETLRQPVLRLIVALIFAAPAAVAGYALVHGVTREAVPSEIWRQIFCIIGGGFLGVSALIRLAAPANMKPARSWERSVFLAAERGIGDLGTGQEDDLLHIVQRRLGDGDCPLTEIKGLHLANLVPSETILADELKNPPDNPRDGHPSPHFAGQFVNSVGQRFAVASLPLLHDSQDRGNILLGKGS